MAVTEVIEVWDGRDGAYATGANTFVRAWLVATDTDDDYAETVLAHADIPGVLDAYDEDQYSADGGGPVCTEVKATQVEESSRHWRVVAQYSTESDDPRKNPDPLLRPYEFEHGEHTYKAALGDDVNGNPIKNTAGDPYVPPFEIEKTIDVFVLTRNQATFDLAQARSFRNTVNNATWNGYGAGDVLIKSIKGKVAWENGKHFIKVAYTFWARKRERTQTTGGAWTLYALSYGQRYKDFDTGELVPVTSAGHKRAGVLLTEEGYSGDDFPGSVPFYQKFTVYGTADFTTLDTGETDDARKLSVFPTGITT